MTREQLLAEIDFLGYEWDAHGWKGKDGEALVAIARGVLERHRQVHPDEPEADAFGDCCRICLSIYPCEDIQAIEAALRVAKAPYLDHIK